MKEARAAQARKLSRRGFFAATVGAALAAATAPFPAQAQHPALTRIRQDWHSHTHRHGGRDDAILKDMIARNEAYGLDLMGLSEHIDRRDERESFIAMIAANRRELEEVGLKTPMHVMIGTEASMLSPTLCCLEEDVAQDLDYVMVSCNHYHLRVVENPAQKTPEAYAEHYLDMLMGAVELGFVDTIGHPFLHMKLSNELGMDALHATLKAYDEARLTEVLKAAADVHMGFEINPHHADHALPWFRELIQEARLHGVKFTLGTDAHSLDALGYPDRNGRSALDIINELTLTNEDLKWTAKLGPRARKAFSQ